MSVFRTDVSAGGCPYRRMRQNDPDELICIAEACFIFKFPLSSRTKKLQSTTKPTASSVSSPQTPHPTRNKNPIHESALPLTGISQTAARGNKEHKSQVVTVADISVNTEHCVELRCKCSVR
jgi:hypothetical protein